MRIRQLDLIRYGHFTKKRLEFPEDVKDPHGIHIIYGPNEAGKSTTLRALACLICGFPRSCEDGFLHGQSNLLLGGEFINSQGKTLFFHRRKGTTNIFSDQNEAPLAPEKVCSFIGNISLNDFQMRYGIDHVELKKGAEQLARGMTDATLLSSVLGGLNLSEVIKSLEETCDTLFKPRGQNQQINKSLKEYEDNLSIIHQKEFQGTKYKDLQKDRTAKEQERTEIQLTIQKQESESNRLQRLQKAIPLANQRETVLQKISLLGEVRRLSPEFKEQRLNAQNSLAIARERLAEITVERKLLEEKLQSLKATGIDQEFEEQVQSLVRRLQSYRDASRDLPSVSQTADQYLVRAKQLAATIPGTPAIDQIMAINLVPQQRQELTQLVEKRNQLSERLFSIQKQINELRLRLTADQANLAGLPAPRDFTKLVDCLHRIEERGDPERELQEKEAHLAELQQRSRVGLSRIHNWQDSLETLVTTTFPRPETIQVFQREFQDIEKKVQETQSEIQKIHKHRLDSENEIQALQQNVSVPTEQDLEEARTRRNQGWALVREAWLEKHDISEAQKEYDPERPLPEAYEHQVENADRIADRLRREAERVTRFASLSASLQQDRMLLEQFEKQLIQLEERQQQKENEWKAIWQATGVSPRTPLEMLGWVQEIPGLSGLYTDIQSDERMIGRLKSEITDLKARLRQEFLDLQVNDPGDRISLRDLRTQARRLFESNEKLDHQRTEIINQISRTNEDIRKFESQIQEERQSLQRINELWKSHVQVFGESIQITPENLPVILSLCDQVHNHMNKIPELKDRIDSMTRTLADFEQGTGRLVSHYAPDLVGIRSDQAVEILADRLKKLNDEVKVRQTLEENLRNNQKDSEKTESAIQATEATLFKLVQEAACCGVEDLASAEERWESYRELTVQLENIDSQLKNLSLAGNVESLIDELQGINPDQLAGEMKVIQDQLHELNRNYTELSEQIGQIQNDLKRFDGSSILAEKATANELILTDVVKSVQNYQRQRLALDLLSSQIRVFLNEYRTPMLSKASGFFSELTQQAYKKLEMDVDEKQNPILQVVSSEDKHLQIEQLSSGTLDQLYLALRLGNLTLSSSLDGVAEQSTPGSIEQYPLVLDDVLINFDNERAKAAFKVFSNLSRSIQVIYFTHHRHLVDLAGEVCPDGELHVQNLARD